MKIRIIYGLLAGLFFSLYWLTWSGALLFVGILGAYLFVHLVILGLKKVQYSGLVLVGFFSLTLGVILFGVPAIFTGPTALATSELASLNLLTAWQNFGVITFLVPVILGLLVYQVVKRGAAPFILLLVWSAVILVITLEHLRFAYYFAVNVALLAGWFIWYTWQKMSKQNVQYAVMAVAILCVLVLVPNVQQATASKNYHTPSDAWCESLEWVKDNTPPDAVILSWWDYGYWIEREAKRRAYCNPSQAPVLVTRTARFLLSPTDNITIGFDYLILDFAITTSKFRSVTIWAGEPIEKYSPEYYQTLLVRLYGGDPLYRFELVYQSEQEIEGVAEVKVFHKRNVWVIDGQ